ncbi:MAG: 3-dehydroquinate synthase [Rhizobiaceae bacterium]|nr:3-dehydroquinate synthase [Rhizobiaceae bacterium]
MNTDTPTLVPVDLGDRSYDIEIGPQALGRISSAIEAASSGARCAIITDTNVNAAHGDKLREYLDDAGIQHDTIEVQAGEKSKSWAVLQEVTDKILEYRLERSDLVLAFGGGVVGDLAGFAASIARRGMKFIQIPTSLLAQVDSSVGGKTGINSTHGKNLVGAFYQPSRVLIDLDILKTLSAREFRAGYAEVAKYGLIKYPEFFAFLEKNHGDVFSHGKALAEAIAKSCQAKAEIVAADETEKGQRALLNLGHTFGHALEGYTAYDGSRLVHGEGVAIGMMLAHQFSNRLNQCAMDDVNRVETHLKAVGLPTRIQDIPGELPSSETLMSFIAQDKKVKRGALTFILTNGIGKSYIADDVPPSEVSAFLTDQLDS